MKRSKRCHVASFVFSEVGCHAMYHVAKLARCSGAMPGAFLNRVSVDSRQLLVNDSFVWFLPNRNHIQFDNVQSLTFDTEHTGGKRPTTRNYLVFHLKDGSVARVQEGTLVSTARETILDRVRAHGIPIQWENHAGP